MAHTPQEQAGQLNSQEAHQGAQAPVPLLAPGEAGLSGLQGWRQHELILGLS